MNLLTKTIIGGLSSLMLVATANAAYINFGNSSDFGGANGQKSFVTTISGIDMQISALQPENALLSQNSKGLGVNSGKKDDDKDQIGGNNKAQEILEILFTNGSINLSKIDISNFWSLDLEDLTVKPEIGIYIVDNGVVNKFTSTSLILGEQSLNVSYDNVSRITFEAVLDGHSEFSLRGLEFAPVPKSESVPEPGMISLLGAGILALSGINFFRKKK